MVNQLCIACWWLVSLKMMGCNTICSICLYTPTTLSLKWEGSVCSVIQLVSTHNVRMWRILNNDFALAIPMNSWPGTTIVTIHYPSQLVQPTEDWQQDNLYRLVENGDEVIPM